MYVSSWWTTRKLTLLEKAATKAGFFVVVNGNLCFECYEDFLKFRHCIGFSCVHTCTSMSSVLFVAINFSAEKTENSEIAVQQIFLHVARMFVLVTENNIHVMHLSCLCEASKH